MINLEGSCIEIQDVLLKEEIASFYAETGALFRGLSVDDLVDSTVVLESHEIGEDCLQTRVIVLVFLYWNVSGN